MAKYRNDLLLKIILAALWSRSWTRCRYTVFVPYFWYEAFPNSQSFFTFSNIVSWLHDTFFLVYLSSLELRSRYTAFLFFTRNGSPGRVWHPYSSTLQCWCIKYLLCDQSHKLKSPIKNWGKSNFLKKESVLYHNLGSPGNCLFNMRNFKCC